MKSKLTLRLDEDLKEQAKRLAEKRGTSVSKIVEQYFKLLLQEDSPVQEGSEEGPPRSDRSRPGSAGSKRSSGSLLPR